MSIAAVQSFQATSQVTGHVRTALFVCTSLDAWEITTPEHYARDAVFNETPYRKLDPTYYAWLRRQMGLVKVKFERGKLSQPSYAAIRDRFNRIHQWAVIHFGAPTLNEAVQNFDPKRYTPPKAHPDHCFHGIHQLPEEQSQWPPALLDIWNEIVRDLTGWDIDRQEAARVAQGIVEVLVTHKPVEKPVEPAKAALPF